MWGNIENLNRNGDKSCDPQTGRSEAAMGTVPVQLAVPHDRREELSHTKPRMSERGQSDKTSMG